MEENQNKFNTVPSLVFVGCMFLGIGGGYLYGSITAGTLISMGVGFIMMAILRYTMKGSGNSSDQKPQ